MFPICICENILPIRSLLFLYQIKINYNTNKMLVSFGGYNDLLEITNQEHQPLTNTTKSDTTIIKLKFYYGFLLRINLYKD